MNDNSQATATTECNLVEIKEAISDNAGTNSVKTGDYLFYSVIFLFIAFILTLIYVLLKTKLKIKRS